jgi:glycine/D-amino acid oxidase-like deaminating enzyme
MLEEKVYWQDTVGAPAEESLSPVPETVDVAVVGGGYTGLSAARALAKRGLKVAVFETHTPGWGASSRNGGMVLTGLNLDMRAAVRRYGIDLARRLWGCSLESVTMVEQIVRDEGIDCGFERAGHFFTASKPRHYAALVDEAEFIDREFGHATRPVPRAQQRAEIESDAFFGGVVDEVSAGLNPAQFVAGLSVAAGKAGAVICAQAPVTRIERRSGRFILDTARGRCEAERVFVATAGHTGRVTPSLHRKIVPVGSFIIATEQLRPDVVRALIPHRRMVFDSKHDLHYFRFWDQRLVFGGRAGFFPDRPSAVRRSAHILRKDMLKVFPRLSEVRVEYAWGGTLGFAFDSMPHVGDVEGIGYALGYSGHGVAFGSYLGQTAAEAMIDGTLRDHPFNATPFPGAPLGLYNGVPWFLPFAGLWYRILDIIE